MVIMEDQVPEADSELDFTSPAFNPAAALAAEGLVPPVPEATLLDNLSKCRALLPADLPDSLAQLPKPAPASEVCI